MNYLERNGVFNEKTFEKFHKSLFTFKDLKIMNTIDETMKFDETVANETIKNLTVKKRKFIVNSNILLCICFVALKYQSYPVTYSDILKYIFDYLYFLNFLI